MATPPLNLRPLTPPPADEASSPSSSSFSYENSPYLYLFTSLTAGSSHIITATSRMETILKANRIPFKAVDCATDEKARRIWSRRAGKRKLPGLVKQGNILADLELVEEWNEFGEIKDHLGGDPLPKKPQPPAQQTTSAGKDVAATPAQPVKPLDSATSTQEPASSSSPSSLTPQMSQQQQLAREVAAIAAQRGKPKATAATPATAQAVPSTKSEPEQIITPRSPPRSPELDEDRDIEDTKHNTSSSTALPPLSIRTNNPTQLAPSDGQTRPRTDTTSSIQSIKSPNFPDAPPPSTTEPSAPSSIGLPDFGVIPEEDLLHEAENDPTASAGPASVSGLQAVTSFAEPESQTGVIHQRSRGSSINAASAEDIAAIEKRDSIPEVSTEDEEDDDEDEDKNESKPNEDAQSADDQKVGHYKSPVRVTYGDGYDWTGSGDGDGDGGEDDEDDEEDDDITESGQIDSIDPDDQAAADEEAGKISPRILHNDPSRHIKFSEEKPEVAGSRLGKKEHT